MTVTGSNDGGLLHTFRKTGTNATSHPQLMERIQKQAVAIAYPLSRKEKQS